MTGVGHRIRYSRKLGLARAEALLAVRYERSGAVCTGHIAVIVDAVHGRARTAWCEDVLELAIHVKKPAAVPVRTAPRTNDNSRRIDVVQRGLEGIWITDRLVNPVRQHEPMEGIWGEGHSLVGGRIPAYNDPCVADAVGIRVKRSGGAIVAKLPSFHILNPVHSGPKSASSLYW